MMRRLVAVVVVVLMLGLSPGKAFAYEPSGSAPAASAVDPDASDASVSDPEAAASEKAKATGDDVIVGSLTSETRLVEAHPDGSFGATLSPEPVRTKEGATWKTLDSDLVRSGGEVHPKVDIGELTLSNGGPAGSEIARFQPPAGDDGPGFAVSSPWALPSPELDGEFATYVDVLPGVDLVVEATSAGFSQNWVVKTAEAARDSRVRALSLPVDTDGADVVRQSGGIAYKDDDGRTVGFTPTPVMWDSSGGASTDSAAAVDGGPSQGDRSALVSTSADEESLVLRGASSMLDSSQTTFPVVIDPAWQYARGSAPARTAWTAVWSNFPNQSFYRTSHKLGAGYEGWEQNKIVRSYLTFNTSGLAGKYIQSAELNVTQVHAASCTSYATYVYRSTSISSATTWNKKPSELEKQGYNTSQAGCSGRADSKVGWNVLTGVTKSAAARYQTTVFEIKGDEGNRNAWKQFDDDSSLYVRYISRPYTPTDLQYGPQGQFAPSCPSTPAEAYTFGATQIQIRAKVQAEDANGNLSLYARVGKLNADGTLDSYQDVPYGFFSDGQTVSINWGVSGRPIVDGGLYKVWVTTRASVYDGSGNFKNYLAPWTSGCVFRVDTTRPAPPVVTLNNKPVCNQPGTQDNAGVACSPVNATAGGRVDVQVQSADSADPAKIFAVKVNGVSTDVPATGGAAVASLKARLAGTGAGGVNTVTVQAKDAGGNLSLPYGFTFSATAAAPAHEWNFHEDGGSTAADLTGSTPMVLSSAASWTSLGRVGRGLQGNNATAAGALDTTHSYSVSAWVRLDPQATGTLLSVPGTTGSSLRIDYGGTGWRAVRNTSDGGGLGAPVGAATSPTGAWTHVAFTFDAVNGDATLFINGVPSGPTSNWSSSWSGSRDLLLGCARSAGAITNCLTGRTDEVQIFDVPLDATQVVSLANPTTGIGQDQTAVVSAGEWRVTGTQWSGDAATPPMDLSGGAAVGASSDPEAGQVLVFPGSSASASGGAARTQSGASVIDSSGSFTVITRVRITQTDKAQVVVRGEASSGPGPWMLRYEPAPGTDGTWTLVRPKSATDPSEVPVASVPIEGDADLTPTELAVVYDNRLEQLGLYVNGGSETSPVFFSRASAWAGTGALVVGSGTVKNVSAPLSGEISYLGAFAGAMSATDILVHCGCSD